MITFLKSRNRKSKEEHKSYKTLPSILESVDTVVINNSATTSVTLSVTSIGLITVPISAKIACSLSLANKVLQKIVLTKYNKRKKHQKYLQTNKSFDKLYRKSLQDNLIDKSEIESLSKPFTKYLDEMEIESLS